MVAARTPPRVEEQPVKSEPPSVNKSFCERLDTVERLLVEARLLMEELKGAQP